MFSSKPSRIPEKNIVPWRPPYTYLHLNISTRSEPQGSESMVGILKEKNMCLPGQGRETNQETHIIAESPLEIKGGLLEDPSFSSI